MIGLHGDSAVASTLVAVRARKGRSAPDGPAGPRVQVRRLAREAPSGSGSGRLAINAHSTDPKGTTLTRTHSSSG